MSSPEQIAIVWQADDRVWEAFALGSGDETLMDPLSGKSRDEVIAEVETRWPGVPLLVETKSGDTVRDDTETASEMLDGILEEISENLAFEIIKAVERTDLETRAARTVALNNGKARAVRSELEAAAWETARKVLPSAVSNTLGEESHPKANEKKTYHKRLLSHTEEQADLFKEQNRHKNNEPVRMPEEKQSAKENKSSGSSGRRAIFWVLLAFIAVIVVVALL